MNASRHFQPGKGPIGVLLHDCENRWVDWSSSGDNIIIGFPHQQGRAAAAAMRREPGPQSHTSYAEPRTLLHTPAGTDSIQRVYTYDVMLLNLCDLVPDGGPVNTWLTTMTSSSSVFKMRYIFISICRMTASNESHCLKRLKVRSHLSDFSPRFFAAIYRCEKSRR